MTFRNINAWSYAAQEISRLETGGEKELEGEAAHKLAMAMFGNKSGEI